MHDWIDLDAHRRARQDEIDAAKWQRGRESGQENLRREDKLRRLKEEIRAGTYKADIKDIAMQLAAAMDPMS
ncbi:flagellar biosynthesis anti-sigma factor FlgM [Paucidesulfovibrio longus]|jgi:anti-sigma28 factor (negative regulator of flagellin synthesis)|uniref:flagellar biosynthesis anti-sigma factor FlgM n=1 Tax=Paucidesulfovibrio longus TaxID=889 RepID=UPI0003B55A30|nr:flagellar biosynthesis anti-sigma factor FlgM [Paucidesulfovibrio longus]